MRDGIRCDVWTSSAIIVGYAIPGFLFAVLLGVLFAGGSFVQWFPLRGLTSDNWDQLSLMGKIVDYFWHLALPVTAMDRRLRRSEEHTSELQSLMRISYAVFCLKKKTTSKPQIIQHSHHHAL